ncbi:MAG: hypothetical protein GY943_16795 [Chloroflexi bacterium]|nr:hypothetical protein [Chloroflexota bacterium]
MTVTEFMNKLAKLPGNYTIEMLLDDYALSFDDEKLVVSDVHHMVYLDGSDGRQLVNRRDAVPMDQLIATQL